MKFNVFERKVQRNRGIYTTFTQFLEQLPDISATKYYGDALIENSLFLGSLCERTKSVFEIKTSNTGLCAIFPKYFPPPSAGITQKSNSLSGSMRFHDVPTKKNVLQENCVRKCDY